MKKTVWVSILIAVVGLGIGFYGGTIYQKSQTSSSTPATYRTGGGTRTGRGGGYAGFGGAASGGSLTTGQVLSKTDQSIVIQLPNSAGSKIVFFTSSTPVSAMVNESIDKVMVGDQVIISGTANTDGSVTAQMLQIRPPTTTPAGAAQ